MAGPFKAWLKAPLYHAPDAAMLAEAAAGGMDAAWVRGAARFDAPDGTLVLLEPGPDALAAAEWAPFGSVLGADPRVLSAGDLGRLANFEGRAVTISASYEHRRGAPAEIEIASALADCRRVVDAMGAEAAARHVAYRVEGEREIVDGIAKIRALRRLHDALLRLEGVQTVPRAFVHAVTSWRTLTKVDPWVNLMRATTQGVAAAVAGADVITVLPFDAALGEPSERGRRLARNTHLVLESEAHLARVSGAGAGAEAIEARTEEFARSAWELLRAGAVGIDAGQQAERDAALRTRKLPITGVSEFPDEAALLERPPAPPEDGMRDAREFEALRERPPLRVHLRALGPLREHKPRLDFARNFFRIGGAEFVEDPAAAVACLCGADDAYDAALVAELKAAGARKVVLAGKADLPGLDATIHRGCDVVATLERLA